VRNFIPKSQKQNKEQKQALTRLRLRKAKEDDIAARKTFIAPALRFLLPPVASHQLPTRYFADLLRHQTLAHGI
jgi:hypothetical protein